MAKRIIWLMLSCLIVSALVLASCGPAAVEEEEEVVAPAAVEEEEEVVVPAAVEEEEEEEEVVAPAAEEPKYGGTLRTRAYLEGLLNFDVFNFFTRRTQQFGSYVYGNLVTFKYGPDVGPGEIVLEPALAESWEMPDDTTYIFHLRKGVRFHNTPPVNGRELVAEDVVFSFEKRMDPESIFYPPLFVDVDKVEALDKYTVRITMKRPVAPFLNYIACYYGYIVAPEVEEQFGSYAPVESGIGTGPWIVEEFTPKVETVFKRNPDYWDESKPYLDRVRELVILDTSTAVAAFRAEQIDTLFMAGQAGDELLEIPGVVILEHFPPLYYNHFSMRNDQPPFDDIRVRQALSLAIDREMLVKLGFGGHAKVEGVITSGHGYFALPIDELGPGAKFWEHDVAEAKRLLAEAGYPDGFTTDVWAGPMPASWHELIPAMLADIGIEVELRYQDYAAFAATTRKGQFDGIATWTTGQLPDVDAQLSHRYLPEAAENFARVNDPELTEMVELQKQTLDKEKRRQIIWDIQRYLADKCYYIYMPQMGTREGVQPWVKGYSYYITEGAHMYTLGPVLARLWIEKQ